MTQELVTRECWSTIVNVCFTREENIHCTHNFHKDAGCTHNTVLTSGPARFLPDQRQRMGTQVSTLSVQELMEAFQKQLPRRELDSESLDLDLSDQPSSIWFGENVKAEGKLRSSLNHTVEILQNDRGHIHLSLPPCVGGIVIPVFENELSSLIAYSLSSPSHLSVIAQISADLKTSDKSSTGSLTKQGKPVAQKENSSGGLEPLQVPGPDDDADKVGLDQPTEESTRKSPPVSSEVTDMDEETEQLANKAGYSPPPILTSRAYIRSVNGNPVVSTSML